MIYSDLNYIQRNRGLICEDVVAVYQAIYTLLNTKLGSRIFRPEYGSRISNYLFEPCDEITARKIRYEVQQTLKQEPRIYYNIAESTVEPVPDEHKFIITIVFTIIGFSDTQRSLTLSLHTVKGAA